MRVFRHYYLLTSSAKDGSSIPMINMKSLTMPSLFMVVNLYPIIYYQDFRKSKLVYDVLPEK